MRVALVHDYLNQYGGAERVLEVFAEMFPEAPIYTLLYDEARTFGRFRGRVKKTSFLDSRFVNRHHRLFIPLLPIAASMLSIPDDYDLIISSTAGYAKGVRYGSAKHVSYCHTPLRYAWEPDYLTTKLGASLPMRLALTPLLAYLRAWDWRAGQKPDVLIANSRFIADKIKKYYGRRAEVVHPPVDIQTFYPDSAVARSSHYLAIGRMLHYKRFDLVIEAFNKLGLPLAVVGEGPELRNLKERTTSDRISFIPFVAGTDKLRRIYCGAKALIFPQVEDFGLVAAEAIACGTPVIAYDAGGAKEIIRHGENGLLFSTQTRESLAEAVQRSEALHFDPARVASSAKQFSKEEFIRNIQMAIGNGKRD